MKRLLLFNDLIFYFRSKANPPNLPLKQVNDYTTCLFIEQEVFAKFLLSIALKISSN